LLFIIIRAILPVVGSGVPIHEHAAPMLTRSPFVWAFCLDTDFLRQCQPVRMAEFRELALPVCLQTLEHTHRRFPFQHKIPVVNARDGRHARRGQQVRRRERDGRLHTDTEQDDDE